MKEFVAFLNQNFGYPYGGLYSNLIASALLGILGFLWGRAFERRTEANHERRHKEVLAAHRKTHEILKNGKIE